MIILPVKATAKIEDTSSHEGQIWSQALDVLESWQGFRRLYWGRHVEEPGKTQVHIGTYTLKVNMDRSLAKYIFFSSRHTPSALHISRLASMERGL